MKKVLCAVLAVVLICLCAGCSKLKLGEKTEYETGSLDGLSMTVKEVDASSGKLTLTVKNDSGIEFDSGNENDYLIEAQKDGEWYTIDVEETLNTMEALCFLDENELVINYSVRYGALPTGHYRVLKYFFPFSPEGEYTYEDGAYLEAVFDIA